MMVQGLSGMLGVGKQRTNRTKSKLYLTETTYSGRPDVVRPMERPVMKHTVWGGWVGSSLTSNGHGASELVCCGTERVAVLLR